MESYGLLKIFWIISMENKQGLELYWPFFICQLVVMMKSKEIF